MLSEVQLLGVTYSEFDNKVGPQLKFSYPPDVLSKEAFEAYSDYVIVSKQLSEKIIVATFDDVQFINYSVSIENSKYHRNALLFAFGFVLAAGVPIEPYCAVLEKISSAFVNLEIESEFLFQTESRSRVQDFLRVLFFQLNTKNEAFIDLGLNNNYLAVKLFRSPLKPPEVMDYEVPMFRKDRIDLSNLPWDISFQHLIPYIDGISHVKKIVYEVGMDIDSVKRSLKLLQFHGAIIMSDVFKFTNVYKLHCSAAAEKLANPALMQEMRQFASLHGGRPGAPLPAARQILAFLLRLQQSRPVQQVLLEALTVPEHSDEQPATDIGASLESKSEDMLDAHLLPSAALPALSLEHLDLARLLAFAQAHGIVRRVYEYPIYMMNSSDAGPRATSRWYPEGVAAGSKVRTNGSWDALNNMMANLRDAAAGMAPASRRPSSTQAPRLTVDQPSGESKSSVTEDWGGYRSSNIAMPTSHHAHRELPPRTPEVQLLSRSLESSAGLAGAGGGGGVHNMSGSLGRSGGIQQFTQGIGLRRSSFEPENRDLGREQDRLEASRGAHIAPEVSVSSSLRTPSIQTGSLFPPRVGEGMTAAERMARHAAIAPGNHPTNTPFPARTLQRFNSRSRMSLHHLSGGAATLAGQTTHGSTSVATALASMSAVAGAGGAGGSSIGGAPPREVANRYEVRDILHKLNGKDHIDAICCRYDLSYQEIANFPGVTLIYK